MNIPLDELVRRMDRMFGNVRNYNSMVQSLYEICQKDSESVEEYMLQVHEAVAVVRRACPDQVPNEGECIHLISLRQSCHCKTECIPKAGV